MWPEGAEHITKTTKRPLTAGTLFKNSMLALMKIIHSKVMIGNVIVNIVMVVLKTGKLYQEPHYIRCIKPNDAKSPVLFDQKLVEHQVHMMMMARVMMATVVICSGVKYEAAFDEKYEYGDQVQTQILTK